ncbi:hypothetical protein [Haloplanus aerogenes]|uniref:Uncharacterized protein n=1 Tax=Haloplanus aerogenes TaxID=660522 RepID=A0A3M0CYF4_9EURY|nr:hypothetical protein [Haloplanus aerogenes]AZH24996.1 hypothetical protein DU502_06255 [Haloplanus aerogenes]RMB13787.1 hypothetical protein ATH50_2228 [Haloplanus aerogenes]
MRDEYLVLSPATELTEDDLQQIQDELTDSRRSSPSVWFESFDPTQEMKGDESDTGFAFNWIEILPIIELLIVGYQIGELTGGNERLARKLRERLDGDLITINSKSIATDPAEWVGTDVWTQLPTETKDDLQKSYDALHEGSETGVILHSAFAIEHLIAYFCEAYCSEIPDDVWKDGIELVQAQMTPDHTANLFSKLEFIKQKSRQINERNESMDEDDAISTVIITRNAVRTVIETGLHPTA